MPETPIVPLRSEFLVQFDIEASPPNELGITPVGRRRVVYVTGGRFHGPRLNGAFVAGGGDMALVRSDGVFEADVRLLLRTDDDALIHVTYRGIWHAKPGVLERVLRREEGVDPNDHALRTAVFFETADARYLWLNTVLGVGMGVPRGGGGISYQIHQII
jgi:hypothetical protein